ncbi:unnamed protein product [Psylliodes chrysocephalus]|uniref:Golgin subfamily A member 7/ERF4 domain-containing protein n=1 Tax=Psylliodes chrysocephalus TaxID=3402493 RepID=A0A9P0CNL8_9CUCU|nr:unnamed protein product [Psylliodes chrysocephala]
MCSSGQKESVIVRPDGNITIFGLCNHFPADMPNKLISITAADEYKYTITRINRILKKSMLLNMKILLCSCLCFCCTLGFSVYPPIMINKRTKHRIKNVLEEENERIYHHLGLHWGLIKRPFGPLPTVEYVLQIEFFNRPNIYAPD